MILFLNNYVYHCYDLGLVSDMYYLSHPKKISYDNCFEQNQFAV